ncbi:MAG TPA: LPS assembly lipoprotein LptE [Candidatus Thiothrix moscowensis]|uniref:LPS-assembly lipoprotein LptE n=1 Tax=unclassified Thiothrix TaxID=2636184 RepID=UPI0025ED3F07|nr:MULTISPECIES: LPS assembly lipoprotein LptE [unclassified Thiothrix]HRJ52448.1 LPS assembly lipoprotein LptE [Candidatus Thiothrix moscowensis]HRJ93366.1 LPS assembly lipoprotein LptE [Candidatus Thiothrix moscowensis]
MKQLFIVIAWLFALAGCSGEPFHLRGKAALPDAVQQGIYLQGVDIYSGFGLALRDVLEDAGAKVTQQPQFAATVLTVTRLDEKRTVSGYSSTRQVREFIHTVEVGFRVKTPALPEAVEHGVRAERSQVYDGEYVLGTADEEVAIREELRQEAARLILLRLQAVK